MHKDKIERGRRVAIDCVFTWKGRPLAAAITISKETKLAPAFDDPD